MKMRHLETDHYWLWSRNKFVNRKYLMQEMYQNYVEGEAWDLSEVRKDVQSLTELFKGQYS